jgi:sugar phosphate isomerase/epimerase
MGASYVRAFLGELNPNTTAAQVYPYIVESLAEILPHARSVNVGIAVEHHDDFVRTSSLTPILNTLSDPMLGAVWDMANAYSAGEDPDEGAANLHGRIFYVQLKDGVGRGPDWRLTKVGEGEVPLRRAFELLWQQQYTGSFSVEWEYAWHPELDPPEEALPRALDHVRRLLNRAYGRAASRESLENTM